MSFQTQSKSFKANSFQFPQGFEAKFNIRNTKNHINMWDKYTVYVCFLTCVSDLVLECTKIMIIRRWNLKSLNRVRTKTFQNI